MQLLSFWTVGTACGSLGGIHYLTINGYVANLGRRLFWVLPLTAGALTIVTAAISTQFAINRWLRRQAQHQ